MINYKEGLENYSNVTSDPLKLEYNIINQTGRILNNRNILRTIIGKKGEQFNGTDIYKLMLTLVTATGNVSVDIEFCSYDPKDGECKSRPSLLLSVTIGAGLAGLIGFIVSLLAFCCYRRRKIQV